jgi:WD40 repeat protein
LLTSDHDIYDLAFSPDGAYLAYSDSEGLVSVWALISEELVHHVDMRGHTDGVTRLAFSPDGTRLATASIDSTARVWDAATGQELLSLTLHDDTLTGISFSPDGRFLATSGAGVTHVYAMNLEDVVALARARLTRSLTDEECRRYLHVDACPEVP